MDLGTVQFYYINWKKERSLRTVIPLLVWYGSTDWHPDPQELLKAYDCDKDQERDFAVADIEGWTPSLELYGTSRRLE